MKNNLYRAVYCSRCELIGPPETITAELQSILATSRRNNRPAGLTGALLFANNCFAQTLKASAMWSSAASSGSRSILGIQT